MTAVRDDTATMPLASELAASPTRAGGSTEALEFWIAIAAGEPVWADPDDEVTPIERWAGALELLALMACLGGVWAKALLHDETTTFERWAPWVATVSLLCMMIRPVRLMSAARRPARLWSSFAVRVVLITAVLACGVAAEPWVGLLGLWPLAVAMGVEAALCAWALGYQVQPLRWWGDFARSPLDLGILGGVVASVVYLGADDTLTRVIPIYLFLHVAVLGSAMVAAGLDRLGDDVEAQQARAVKAAVAAEHRQSAHWLHDDVSSELKLVELKLRQGQFGAEEVAQAIGDLDHQLRLRQLDELYRSGTVRLAEILQPFVRNAQGHGVAISSVPTFDDASVVIDERLGRLFGRAVAVLTNNAIAAGATQLGFTVHADEVEIAVTVIDDAGGFELSRVPAGRGLWQLGQELGTGNISAESVDGGSAVTVVLNREGPRFAGRGRGS